MEVEGWKWKRVTSMTTPRCAHSCVRAGSNIIVVGGLGSGEAKTTSEIFSLDSLSWTTGPGVPPTANGQFGDSAVCQLEDTFYLLGGYDDNSYLDTVYEFDPKFFTWKLKEERLETARDDHALVPIPKRILGA